MHGLTGGSWKRSHDRATATEMNNPTGNRAVPMALRPTADQGHRASSRPSIGCPRGGTFRLRCARWRYPSRMAAARESSACPPSRPGRANGGGREAGGEGRADLPRRLLRLPAGPLGVGRGGHVSAALLEKRLGDRPWTSRSFSTACRGIWSSKRWRRTPICRGWCCM